MAVLLPHIGIKVTLQTGQSGDLGLKRKQCLGAGRHPWGVCICGQSSELVLLWVEDVPKESQIGHTSFW